MATSLKRSFTVPLKSTVLDNTESPSQKNLHQWLYEDDYGSWHLFSDKENEYIESSFLLGQTVLYMEGNRRIDFGTLIIHQLPLSNHTRKIEETTDTPFPFVWNPGQAWSQLDWPSFGNANDNFHLDNNQNLDGVHARMSISPLRTSPLKRIRRIEQQLLKLPPIPPISEPPHKFTSPLRSLLPSSLQHLDFGVPVTQWHLVCGEEQIAFDYQTSCIIEHFHQNGTILISLNKHNIYADSPAIVDLKNMTIQFKKVAPVVEEQDGKLMEAVVNAKKTEFSIQRSQQKLPFDWTFPQHEQCQLVQVPKNSVEFYHLEDAMMEDWKTLKIESIHRIQNKYLWNRYMDELEHVAKINHGNPNEKFLFHGTKKVDPKKIYNGQCGFDFRFATEGFYGTGAYFAANPFYSHKRYKFVDVETWKMQILIARVICGDVYEFGKKKDQTLKSPPQKFRGLDSPFAIEHYDSVCGTSTNTTMWVVYSHYKAYPMYLITYDTQ